MKSLTTNIASLQTQRYLSQTTRSLEKVFEHLSSGLRINRASDDAAGLAIASGLQVDSRVHSQAIRNVNDAVSLYSIAEGAAQELSSIVIRIRELASQSANGVLSNVQRGALDLEAQELREEFNRIVSVTEFNQLSLLDGSLQGISVQTGYDGVALALPNLEASLVPDGTFDAKVGYAAGDEPWGIAAGDINGDGALDIVGTGYYDSEVNVLLGNGDGTFKARISFGDSAGPMSVLVLDLNGDGALDIATSMLNHPATRVMLGNGDGTFRAQVAYIGSRAHMAASDLNNDGAPDLITAGSTTDAARVLINNGDGTFQALLTFAAGDDAFGVTIGDVNGDGKADLMTANLTDNTINLLLGNGNGTFNARTSFAGGDPWGIASSDVNGDGALDIAWASQSEDKFYLMFGNGNGTFRASVSYAAGDGANSMMMADVDLDGEIDLLSTSQNDNKLTIFYGHGDGTFQAGFSQDGGDFPRAVVVGDFDSDEIPDLVASARNDDSFNIFLGNGTAASTLASFSIATQEDALSTMDRFESVLHNISMAIGDMGSSVSRLSVAAATLATRRENYDSAASQILDADVATEAAQLVRLNILQQAASAVLSQANQLPALALKLLKG